MEELTSQMVETIRSAAKKMTGSERREFEAQVSLDYLCGDPRLTETVFGWSRHTVAKGLQELRSGQIIPDAPRTYRPKTEEARPQLAQDIMDEWHLYFLNVFWQLAFWLASLVPSSVYKAWGDAFVVVVPIGLHDFQFHE